MIAPHPLATVLEAVPMPVLAADGEARIVAANAPARALLGEGIVGRLSSSVLRHPAFLSALDAVLAGSPKREARMQLSCPGGEQSLIAHVSAMTLESGPGVLAAFEDLTQQEQAESIRRDFVANVSHELRTPLTALVGFIETLKGPARNDAAARERFLAIMEREAGRMIRLVNDLLSLSRVEAEERRRPSDEVELTAIVRSVLATLRPQATEAGVTLNLAGDAGPIALRADADQITQVLQNLVENAVKYGGSGREVTVRLSRIEREPVLRGPAVQIEVIDRGEGIAAIHLPRLTERFYRIDTHRSREKGGTGLGLAIVKHIVNRHRGRLRIESERGKGSNFIVILPRV